ncbi:MAG: MBL fold metallo-hydrolase [Chloroflexota bacterium]
MDKPKVSIETLVVGDWGTNCYILRTLNQVAIVDPGAEADRILATVKGNPVEMILVTHGHSDHVQALDQIRSATGAPIFAHKADAHMLPCKADTVVSHQTQIMLGDIAISTLHVPGHTPGSVCFLIAGHALVGDAVFPGGPGHTKSHEDLKTSLHSLEQTVMKLPEDTVLHPGHGEGGTVGDVLSLFTAFLEQPLPPDLYGDVEWI